MAEEVKATPVMEEEQKAVSDEPQIKSESILGTVDHHEIVFFKTSTLPRP